VKILPKIPAAVLIFIGVFLTLPNGYAQTELEKKEEKLINLGLISLSSEYSLGRDGNHIIFKIKNNSSRTLSTIYGWVYVYREDEKGAAEKLELVNNPHRGGILVEGIPQWPGQWGQWRFPIQRPPGRRDSSDKYRLHVYDRGVFFSRSPRSSIQKKNN